MALTLCPNCRLPVNASAQRCALCTAELEKVSANRTMPVAAAAVAMVATTLAFVARRWA